MEPKRDLTVNGESIVKDDVNTLAENAALADDRVLAELLRLAPFDATNYAKAIVPNDFFPTVSTNRPPGATVKSSGSANGRLYVYPFRALAGSRVAAATSGKRNWRDIRSAIAVGATTLLQEVQLTDGDGANPRWDLVYAQIAIDPVTATEVRKVKDPTTSATSEPSLPVVKQTTVTILVQTGTPGATPAFPAAPADSSSTINVPLAYVRIPTSWVAASSTILAKRIREAATVVPLSKALGARTVRGAAINDVSLKTSALDAWGVSDTRPEYLWPRTAVGAEQLFTLLDLKTPAHANGDTVDASVDWRNRYIRWFALAEKDAGAAGFVFASSDPATAANAIPVSGSNQSAGKVEIGVGQSFKQDAALVASSSTVMRVTPTHLTDLAAASVVGLYVDSAGVLKLFVSGSPGVRMILWIEASAAMPNFS